MIESPEELRANLRDVRDAVTAAAARAGRDPADVTLIGVTKTLPARVASIAKPHGSSPTCSVYEAWATTTLRPRTVQ